MTAVQIARTAGFRASLSKRGVTLQLLPSGPELSALVDTQPGVKGQYELAQEERQKDILAILRVDLGTTQVGIGKTLQDTDTGARYVVQEVRDNPVDIAVRFVCESTSE